MRSSPSINGFTGLELVKQGSPRVIVTDINMPDMDGMTMVKALRADAITQDIAILMLTSESSVESEMRALAIGADNYLVKPVEPRRLAARVKALLARTRGRDSSRLQRNNDLPGSGHMHFAQTAAPDCIPLRHL
jgi:DNA-binding response OmpR family regulator